MSSQDEGGCVYDYNTRTRYYNINIYCVSLQTSTLVDEGRKCWTPAIEIKARAVRSGREEERPPRDPGFQLLMGGRGRRGRIVTAVVVNGMGKQKKRTPNQQTNRPQRPFFIISCSSEGSNKSFARGVNQQFSKPEPPTTRYW